MGRSSRARSCLWLPGTGLCSGCACVLAQPHLPGLGPALSPPQGPRCLGALGLGDWGPSLVLGSARRLPTATAHLDCAP